MSDTYCGKECSNCQQKEILDCPGCKAGPGNICRGDCPLSSCIREKCHESCDTCNRNGRCSTQARRDTMAQERVEENERTRQRMEMLRQRSPILAKWLNILFIINIISLIVGVLDNFSDLSQICSYVQIVMSFGGAFCLWKMRGQEKRYQTAAVLTVMTAFVSLVQTLWIRSTGLLLVFSLASTICGLTRTYTEFKAHAAVVQDYDSELSQKWERLWQWYIGVYVLTIAGLFLALISSVLGLITAFVGLIGMIVAGIRALVLLFYTSTAVAINL